MKDNHGEDHSLFRETVLRFVEREILPHYESWEKAGSFPRQIWNQLGELNLLTVDIPEKYGGGDTDFVFSMTVLDILSRHHCASLSGSIAVHSDIVAHYIFNHGTEAQKSQYLPKMASGEVVGAIAMTEPGAGSDLQSISTTAKRSGDNFLINGSKTFITNGQHSDLVIVAARTEIENSGKPKITLFLVDADAPGFQRGRKLEKIGLHAADTSELFFENVEVPAAAVLGEVNAGFAILMSELQRERVALAVTAVAAAEGALQETIAYVKERQVFGAPLSTMQNTRFRLAEMATDVQIHRTFVDECVRKFQAEMLDVATVSMAKYATTEMQSRVMDGCLQLYGGYGYMREYGISRAFVDARVQRIYGGTTEIMKEVISRSLLE